MFEICIDSTLISLLYIYINTATIIKLRNVYIEDDVFSIKLKTLDIPFIENNHSNYQKAR